MENIFLAVKKLAPQVQINNPVMFVVYVGAILLTVIDGVNAVTGTNYQSLGYDVAITLILWVTVLFANYADAVAEGRGRAQAESLKKSRHAVPAHRLEKNGQAVDVTSDALQPGDIVQVVAGEVIPMDGEVILGTAAVDESAITGESSPVIREAGGDRSSVTGGTTVLSDNLQIKITARAGESFLDQMIHMIEGAKRQKTPNEIALQILLVTLTIIFLIVVATLLPFSQFANDKAAIQTITITNLAALLVCLAPTTIGALLSAIGISGMSRLNQENVLAKSGRAIEAAGDVDILLLDKTGTITLGNRQAVTFKPIQGVSEHDLAEAAWLASMADETPEGRSVVNLARDTYQITTDENQMSKPVFVPFSAATRMSGVDIQTDHYRKGAADSVQHYIVSLGASWPDEATACAEAIAKNGGTPLIVTKNTTVLGVIDLKDIVKPGVREQFKALRKMGIKSVMITGDNPLTAAAIAAEAGVDDYIAQAVPESKLAVIKKYQQAGHLVAMTGDGTNDAPALAQADVAVAMNTGTVAAKEAGNMIDLDSSPTKLIKIVAVGKQLLMTRGALTTFSITNDLAKYFAILPALFVGLYPQLAVLNFMHLTSPKTAILAALLYNALIIIGLIPVALRGVRYRELGAEQLLRQNLLIYGLGGIFFPFVVIKIFDMILTIIGVK
ncbi:potassium-transporting ATPase subunit KdpB [Leuconostoc lactis]|uniref:potassium-transporting ATPase subunit KdpB n=2 Tax=Leuconostoc lactis TaxID=1246 RepID=UPI000814CC5E|nr:potassium-transporting ATPase subunit KdpB [Leuconostoc lactis]ANY12287.1 K+-transporting ATPase subunit B [Leuconostoc lactis]MSB65654.1 potassium-transporting ATPase subunit KdpB [Leuconostoc lactis]